LYAFTRHFSGFSVLHLSRRNGQHTESHHHTLSFDHRDASLSVAATAHFLLKCLIQVNDDPIPPSYKGGDIFLKVMGFYLEPPGSRIDGHSLTPARLRSPALIYFGH
jgi:hypothetical protein